MTNWNMKKRKEKGPVAKREEQERVILPSSELASLTKKKRSYKGQEAGLGGYMSSNGHPYQ